MIRISESTDDDKMSKFTQYLDEQGYSYESMIDYVLDHITDSDKYFGISLAYSSDYSDKYTISEVKSFAKSIIDDYFVDKIIELGPDYEYDYIDELYDLLKDKEVVSDIEEFDNGYESLVDKQTKDWQDEIDYLNKSYERDAMPPGTFMW